MLIVGLPTQNLIFFHKERLVGKPTKICLQCDPFSERFIYAESRKKRWIIEGISIICLNRRG